MLVEDEQQVFSPLLSGDRIFWTASNTTLQFGVVV